MSDDVVGLAVCGAPLASRSPDVARALVAEHGAPLEVRVSPAGADWVDLDELSDAAGAPAKVRLRRPDEPRPPQPDRVVVFPLTFSTANKAAHGIQDTGPSGTLCDALSLRIPVVATLMVSERSWHHPAWAATLRVLGDAGMRFLDPRTGDLGEPTMLASGEGGDVVRAFDPMWVVAAARSLLQ